MSGAGDENASEVNSVSSVLDRYQSLERKFFAIGERCSSLLRLVYAFPVFLSLLLLVVGYYGLIVLICYEQLFVHGYRGISLLCTFTFTPIWSIGVLCLFRAMFTHAGRIPTSFIENALEKNEQRNPNEDKDVIPSQGDGTVKIQCTAPLTSSGRDDNITQETIRAIKQGYIICRKCETPRPPRSHHCRICKECCCRMDHHCPVLNNCVGHKNYKFFVLTVFYCFIGCLEGEIVGITWFFLPGLPSLVGWRKYFIAFGAGLGTNFLIAMGLFGAFHLWLISNNLTTLEALATGIRKSMTGKQVKNFFNVGAKKNFRQIFGNNPFLWFLPVFTSLGDGCHFPVNEKIDLDSIPVALSNGDSLFNSVKQENFQEDKKEDVIPRKAPKEEDWHE